MKYFIKRPRVAFLVFWIWLLTPVFFQNCGVSQPKVEDLSSLSASSFSHSPIPSSCLSCHAEIRPTESKTLSNDGVSNLFFHDASFGGDQDCVACHTQQQQDVGKSWRNGIFNHKSNTGSTVSTCNSCHTGNRPTTGSFAHTSANGRMGECIGCHLNVGANWSTSVFSHTPMPVSCMSCHSSARPSPTVYFPSDSNQPTINLFAHATQYNGAADCVLCHTATPGNVGISWLGASYNHQNNLGGTVTACTNCHAGNRPTSGTSAHTSVGGRDGECASCHTNAGVNWAANSFSHTPTPTACASCHESARPSASVFYPANPSQAAINLYAHKSQYNGAADCVSCHTSAVANIGVRWAGGYYNHKLSSGSTVSTCTECHTGSRPSDHTSKGYTGDCSGCHKNAGSNWSASTGGSTGGGTSSSIPASVVYLPPTGTTWASVTTSHPSTASRTGMTCATCHTNYNSTLSIIGFDHSAMPTGTKCLSCHVRNQQVVDSTKVSLSLVSSTHKGVSMTKDCNSCHKASYPSWNSTTKSFSGGSW